MHTRGGEGGQRFDSIDDCCNGDEGEIEAMILMMMKLLRILMLS